MAWIKGKSSHVKRSRLKVFSLQIIKKKNSHRCGNCMQEGLESLKDSKGHPQQQYSVTWVLVNSQCSRTTKSSWCLLNSNSKVTRWPLTSTCAPGTCTTAPTCLSIPIGTHKFPTWKSLTKKDIKQERWLRWKTLGNTCYIWLKHVQPLTNVLWFQSHASWRAGWPHAGYRKWPRWVYLCLQTLVRQHP